MMRYISGHFTFTDFQNQHKHVNHGARERAKAEFWNFTITESLIQKHAGLVTLLVLVVQLSTFWVY